MGRARRSSRPEPIGVLLAIEPWNYPFYQVVRVAGPNLVLGNTVLLKHAEINPQCALAIEQLFRDAGAPEGVFTNVFLRIADVEQVIADPPRPGRHADRQRAGRQRGRRAGRQAPEEVGARARRQRPVHRARRRRPRRHRQGRDDGPDAEHRPGLHRRPSG